VFQQGVWTQTVQNYGKTRQRRWGSFFVNLMNWNQELLNSFIWLGKTYAVTLIAFSLVSGLVLRCTVWGRQFWSLTGAYFSWHQHKTPLLSIALLLLFVLFSVRMNVLFSFWYNGFYSGLQALDVTSFWFHVKLFAVLATIHVVRMLLNSYIEGAFVIHWRKWLNENFISDWLHSKTYYLGRFAKPAVDNPDQRIQQDITSLATDAVTLSMGLVNAAVSMYEFTIILWGLSTPMTIFEQEIPRAMVFLVYVYVLTATVFAFWIGRPLIKLNFLKEKLNATYRYLLVRIKEYGESIALYQGEHSEKERLRSSFGDVIANAWQLLWRGIKLDGYNLSVGQTAVLFPLLIQGPRLFTGSIKLGDVMQTTQAFRQVEDALSFFRTSYDSFASYRAVLDRLNGFQANVEATRKLPLPHLLENAMALTLKDLTIQQPDGTTLTRALNLSLNPGQSLLIKGASGTGKTTLIRALAGLWPFTEGMIERPSNEVCLFLSQRPYLPLGTLRSALAYPAQTVSDEMALSILDRIHLGHLCDQIDLDQDWSQVLSPGEQQRLAFGRTLANKPAVVFLDEATSAIDSGVEHSLYTLLRAELPHAIFLSVGHRDTLLAFHDKVLTLERDGSWLLENSALSGK
jgi:putative ATP-binding cassette transporter